MPVDPKPTPPVDPDEEWFKSEGVTDDKEKAAIKARARVHMFAEHKKAQLAKKAEEKETPEKKWYD